MAHPRNCPHCRFDLASLSDSVNKLSFCPSCGGSLAALTAPAESPAWFYLKDERKVGPFTLGALRQLVASGVIAPDDLTWEKGQPDWAPAATVPGLFVQVPPVVDDVTVAANPVLPATQSETVSNLGDDPAMMRSTLGMQEPPQAKGRTKVPVLTGYEVLSVLGRGGMGVVYKARQVSLKRLVALKMILGGGHAGPDDLARFRSEAEAVARFQHPNIVQIYEVSEHDGLPFFSLEFVEGGSLAQRLASHPLPHDEAARLLETLARAAHYAHQQQVVHRDLKPANVLLTADGQPKIADFGLAKQLDDAGQTRSGAIMGTPSYMAPEQAAGRLQDISPLTDVYALGAILYEMLTGRPPFRQDSIAATLDHVRTRDPIAPSRLQPRVPRDLETICLKCLAKEPARRYASALALAQDLESFRAGEAIKARPEGLVGRLWRKVRRRPLAVAASAAGILVASVAVGYFALQASTTTARFRETTELISLVQQDLADEDWSRRDVVEERLDRLAQLAPEQASGLRQEFHKRFAESIASGFQRATLEEDTVAHARAQIAWLESRDADEARRLSRLLEDRTAGLDRVIALKPPFTHPESDTPAKLFKSKQPLKIEDGSLRATWKSVDGIQVLTQVACQGNVELKAVFQGDWERSTSVGLILNGGEGALSLPSIRERPIRGYEFLIQASAKAGVTFAEARAGGTPFRVVIIRNGLRLAQRDVKPVAFTSPVLRLGARRVQDRLQFQINDLEELEAVDLYPLTGADAGVFGLSWPGTIRLESLYAYRQALPPAPTAVERGDELEAAGKWNEALAVYREQGHAARDAVLRRQARFKEGMALVRLRQYGPAEKIFEAFVKDKDPRWQALASSQLWVIRLRQGRFDDAEAVYETLVSQYSMEKLAAFIPEYILLDILQGYTAEATGLRSLILSNPLKLRNLEKAVAIERMFGGQQTWSHFFLFRAYFGVGDFRRARAMAEEMMADRPDLDYSFWLPLVEEYCWVLRSQGEPAAALTTLDRHLFTAPGILRKGREALLVERARILAALGRWDEAERAIETFLPLDRSTTGYERNYHNACLMCGFLRERRKDDQGAQVAWKQAVSLPQLARVQPSSLSLSAPAIAAMVSLSGGLSELELRLANLAIAKFLGHMEGPPLEDTAPGFAQRDTTMRSAALFVKAVQSEVSLAALASITRNLFTTPEGRALARQYAFQELPVAPLFRRLVIHVVMQAGRELLTGEKLSPEQDVLMQGLAEQYFDALNTGRLGEGDLVRLGLTWRGVSDVFGWRGVADTLRPYADLRGPSAYFYGLRYLKLKKPKEAADFFRTARDDAAPDAPLRRLAETELGRLDMK